VWESEGCVYGQGGRKSQLHITLGKKLNNVDVTTDEKKKRKRKSCKVEKEREREA
jgi:hypothetical protein